MKNCAIFVNAINHQRAMLSYIKEIINKIKYRNRAIIVRRTARIHRDSVLEGLHYFGKGCYFRGFLGRGSYIGQNTGLEAWIGRYTSIAPEVTSNPGRHPYKAPYATSSPIFYGKDVFKGKSYAEYDTFEEYCFADKEHRYAVVIGNDVWIGQRAFLCGGVHVGDGAVILAGSVVTKDVEPYAIVGGVPAKVVGYRFDEETIEFLKEIQWWNFPEKWLKENWLLFNDIEKLKAYPGIRELAKKYNQQ